MDEAAPQADIFLTATGCKGIIRPNHLQAMKNEVIVCNIGHLDCEIDMAWLEKNAEINEEKIKDQVDHFIFPDGKKITILARGRKTPLRRSSISAVRRRGVGNTKASFPSVDLRFLRRRSRWAG